MDQLGLAMVAHAQVQAVEAQFPSHRHPALTHGADSSTPRQWQCPLQQPFDEEQAAWEEIDDAGPCILDGDGTPRPLNWGELLLQMDWLDATLAGAMGSDEEVAAGADGGEGPAPAASQHALRQQQDATAWAALKTRAFQQRIECAAVPDAQAACDVCCGPAVVHCLDCHGIGRPAVLCTACDHDTHQHVQLHRRQGWLNGYLQPLQLRDRVHTDGGTMELQRAVGE